MHTKVYAIKEAKRLPPVDYSVSIYSRKIFKVSDPVQEIVNASCRFGFTKFEISDSFSYMVLLARSNRYCVLLRLTFIRYKPKPHAMTAREKFRLI